MTSWNEGPQWRKGGLFWRDPSILKPKKRSEDFAKEGRSVVIMGQDEPIYVQGRMIKTWRIVNLKDNIGLKLIIL